MTTLKPCPFCGSKARPGYQGVKNHFVTCSNCYAYGELKASPEEAAESWDQRENVVVIGGNDYLSDEAKYISIPGLRRKAIKVRKELKVWLDIDQETGHWTHMSDTQSIDRNGNPRIAGILTYEFSSDDLTVATTDNSSLDHKYRLQQEVNGVWIDCKEEDLPTGWARMGITTRLVRDVGTATFGSVGVQKPTPIPMPSNGMLLKKKGDK